MPNVNDFDRLYRRTKTAVGHVGPDVRLTLEPVKPRTLRVLTHVTVENKTNDYEKCRLGIHRAGRDHFLDEIGSPLEAELCVSRSDILLGEADVFFALFVDTDTDDELVMTCVGWEQDLK